MRFLILFSVFVITILMTGCDECSVRANGISVPQGSIKRINVECMGGRPAPQLILDAINRDLSGQLRIRDYSVEPNGANPDARLEWSVDGFDAGNKCITCIFLFSNAPCCGMDLSLSYRLKTPKNELIQEFTSDFADYRIVGDRAVGVSDQTCAAAAEHVKLLLGPPHTP